jgi:eukaryotic-like serine/threonine-protein kinase
MVLRPRDSLGQYELESAIGEGGLGEIWKARDIASGRQAALRILPTPPAADPHRFARFEHDVRKLAPFSHPNIAKVYGLLDAGDVRALAYEWVEGLPLSQRVARGPLPIDEAVRIVAQVANALGAAHTRDVVHGSVKPSNIKICPDGLVKVLDFGLAEVFEPEKPSPSAMLLPASARLLAVITGSGAYMSPEQVRGCFADTRSDVWGLGCVLFELLTGRPAFVADDLVETMTLVTRTEPEWTLLPADTPPSLVRMLHRCLDKDAAARFHRATEALASIREAIGEEGAVEPFLRRVPLRRLPHLPIEPHWSDEIWFDIETALPSLRRWAQGRLPPGLDVNVDDVVADTINDAAESLKRRPPVRPDLFLAFLRQALMNRVHEAMRGRRSAAKDDRRPPKQPD